jgi:hypothetical protein
MFAGMGKKEADLEEDVRAGGASIDLIPPEGTIARELHDFRTRMGEERGKPIPRREMAALISACKTADDPFECSSPYVTYWEGNRRQISEIVVHRYGRVFGRTPMLDWEAVKPGAKLPRPGQAVPVSHVVPIAPSVVAPPGSWGRALNDLRDANGVLRAEMARRLGVGANIITRLEGGHVVRSPSVERYAAEFGVWPRLRWVPVGSSH